MSTHMVAFGASGSTPKQRMVQMAAGLGILPFAGERFSARQHQMDAHATYALHRADGAGQLALQRARHRVEYTRTA